MTRRDTSAYWEAVERAAYYRWAAQRGLALPGNDPVTGRRRDSLLVDREESLVAFKAMARLWLARARQLRELRAGVLP
jgi:hypothetical protein